MARIRDYSSPKLVPSPKSQNPNPKTQNPNRKLIIQISKDEFVWDESSDSRMAIINDYPYLYRD